MIDLSIIIVNYNTFEFTKKCINSIYQNTYGVIFEIILIDNASSDGSQNLLKNEFPQITFILNNENLGFAKANNQGIAISEGRHILLLNSDAFVTAD